MIEPLGLDSEIAIGKNDAILSKGERKAWICVCFREIGIRLTARHKSDHFIVV